MAIQCLILEHNFVASSEINQRLKQNLSSSADTLLVLRNVRYFLPYIVGACSAVYLFSYLLYIYVP